MSDILNECNRRSDGRLPTDLRPFICRLGIYSHTDGSAFVQMGNTKVRVCVCVCVFIVYKRV
jgi:exosome complex component RRP41